jgi:hypothetical protein
VYPKLGSMKSDTPKWLPSLISILARRFEPGLISVLVLLADSLPNAKRFIAMMTFLSLPCISVADAQLITQPYQYTGGAFTVKIVFNFNTNIVTDSVAGTTRLQPILTVTNIITGRSITTSYISQNDYNNGAEGNMLVGNEMNPGQVNPRTNTGEIKVDASSLGTGPLVFTVLGVSELSALAPASSRNVFGGPFYVWTIFPQKITPSLPLYRPPANSPPPGNPGLRPVSTNIHAVIISGRSDPAKIVTSQNVTLTGGVVALGKNPAPPAAPSSWTIGLHIVPDEALLTGAKIPPLIPNIIDVRIVKHEVIGDLVAPGASASP